MSHNFYFNFTTLSLQINSKFDSEIYTWVKLFI